MQSAGSFEAPSTGAPEPAAHRAGVVRGAMAPGARRIRGFGAARRLHTLDSLYHRDFRLLWTSTLTTGGRVLGAPPGGRLAGLQPDGVSPDDGPPDGHRRPAVPGREPRGRRDSGRVGPAQADGRRVLVPGVGHGNLRRAARAGHGCDAAPIRVCAGDGRVVGAVGAHAGRRDTRDRAQALAGQRVRPQHTGLQQLQAGHAHRSRGRAGRGRPRARSCSGHRAVHAFGCRGDQACAGPASRRRGPSPGAREPARRGGALHLPRAGAAGTDADRGYDGPPADARPERADAGVRRGGLRRWAGGPGAANDFAGCRYGCGGCRRCLYSDPAQQGPRDRSCADRPCRA